MKIGTKCSFKKDELLCAVKKGLPYLEFHTFIQDFEGNIDFKEIKEILKNNNVKCHAIHSPISDYTGATEPLCIGTLLPENRKSNIELLKKCIKLANYLCETENPIVVVHIGTSYKLNDSNFNKLTSDDLKKVIEEATEDLATLNNYILKNYPKTIIVVENMPTMCYSKNKEALSWYLGRREDFPLFIEKLNLSNIKTCLDICHLTTTMRTDKMTDPFSNKTLSHYIDCYSSTLKLVHLNNCINLGEITEYHSQPFSKESEDDINLLVEFFTGIKRNNIDCFITLEINQSDYLTQTNTDLTIEAVNKALEIVNQKNISL